eukprot:jgi/Undpi1/11106/HiC_scaffold_30.g13404.m1
MSIPHILSRVSTRSVVSLRTTPGGIAFRALSTASNKPGGGAAAASKKPDMALLRELREASGAPIVDCKNALAADGVEGDIGLAFQWLRKRGIAKATSMADRSANEGVIGLRVDGPRGALVEVNSETDFVARNAKFQGFVEKALEAALEKAAGGGAFPVTRELDVHELLRVERPGTGEVLADSLAHLIGAVRENVTISRAQVVSLGEGEGVVGGYVHGAMGPGVGKNAALVALKLDGATLGNSGAADTLNASAKSLAMHVVAMRPAFLDEASAPKAAMEKEKNLLLDEARESGKNPKYLDKMVEGRLRKFLDTNALVCQAHMVAEGNPKVSDYLRDLKEEAGGTVRRCSKSHGSGGVGSGGQEVFKRHGSGRSIDEVTQALAGNSVTAVLVSSKSRVSK